MTTISPTLCRACERLDRSTGPVPYRCTAYPDGIPMEIAAYGEDHREPRGDETDGLVFAQADSDVAREAFADWKRFGDVSVEESV